MTRAADMAREFVGHYGTRSLRHLPDDARAELLAECVTECASWSEWAPDEDAFGRFMAEAAHLVRLKYLARSGKAEDVDAYYAQRCDMVDAIETICVGRAAQRAAFYLTDRDIAEV